jgi:membrane fusion protein, multidrug efflux system
MTAKNKIHNWLKRVMPAGAMMRFDHTVHTLLTMERAVLRSRLMLGGIIVAVVLIFFYWVTSGRWVSTDNAYIHSAKLMVSTDVSGIVSQVEVKEGARVKAGQVLFRVDPQQFEYALQAAQAQLAQIKITLLAAQQDYIRLQSDIAAQEAQVALAEANNTRAAALALTRAGTDAAYDQARFTLAVAQKQLQSMHQQADAALTRLGGDARMPVDMHPQYRAARAQVEEAQRQLDHTIVRAPFDGIVTAVDNLQPGTFLVSQTAALTNTGAVGLVSTQNLWIEANVKETDLTFARVGNPVSISVDAYPGRIFKGRVVSIAPASGAEFSILPAQNSSGNWVKVVQRVPVRIDLDEENDRPPLRSGMSVIAEIDTGHHRSLSELWGPARYNAADEPASR